jgi:alpha-galactosidase/6-phospho-beta-glucosidase family protein
MEIDASRIQVISAGLNHWVWALKILIDGKDATAEFHARVRKDQAKGYYQSSVELLDALGVWPMPGANHVAEFFPYFYGEDSDGRAAHYPYREGHDFDARLVRDREQREKLKRQGEGKEPLGHKPEESGADAVQMMISMWTNRRAVYYANVENAGIVPNLPDYAIVEVPALADSAGIRGMQVGPLPASVVGLVQARVAFFELLADAALAKSKALALQCLLADTNTTSLLRARACIDEMFDTQAEFLPGYE